MTLVQGAGAANQYWDSATNAGYQHGNGTWSTAVPGWTVNGISPLAVWTNNNKANFSATGFASSITLIGGVATTGVVVNGSGYSLIVTNGGQLTNTLGGVILGSVSSSNRLDISGGSGPASIWDNGNRSFFIGYGNNARSNTVEINGYASAGSAILTNISQLLVGVDGASGSATMNNSLLVTGGGMLYLGSSDHIIGGHTPANYYDSFSNRLEIAGGGRVYSSGQLYIGKTSTYQGNHRGNRLVVRDAGSLLDMKGTNITIGSLTSGGGAYYVRENELWIDGGTVTNVAAITVSIGSGGALNSVYNNGITVTNGGGLYSRGAVRLGLISNSWASVSGSNSVWDLGGSTLSIGAAAYYGVSNVLTIDQGGAVLGVGTATLYPTNDLLLQGGTLTVSNMTSTKGSLFMVGDGVQPATLNLWGGTVTNSAGILVHTQGVVAGNGRLTGGSTGLVLENGAALIPGQTGKATNSIGALQLGDSTWYGGVALELNVTNVAGVAGVGWDQVRVFGTLSVVPAGSKLKIKLDSLGETDGGFNPAITWYIPLVEFAAGSVMASNIEVDASRFLIGSNWTLEVTSTDIRYVYQRTSPFIYVSSGGDNSAGTNWSTAYTTLSNALMQAQNYDTLYVAGQTFDITNQLNVASRVGLSILGGYEGTSDLTLPGPCDAAVWPTAVQRSAGVTRILSLYGLTNCVIRDLIIRNGITTVGGLAGSGAGVNLTQCSGLTLDRCVITNNVANDLWTGGAGGGMYAASSVFTLTNCLIAKNRATGGGNNYGHCGGLYVGSGVMTMTMCRVSQNSAYGAGQGSGIPNGGGLFLGTAASSFIVRSVIDRNSCPNYGGGIYNTGRMDLRNSLVVQNNSGADDGDGLCLGGAGAAVTVANCTVADNPGVGILYVAGAVEIAQSIIWGHSDDLKAFPTDGQVPPTLPGVSFSCIGNGDNLGRQGCVSINPHFANTNDYHLQSKQGVYTDGYFSGGSWTTSPSNSPCIDAGDPALDAGLEPVPNGGRINMGAYGNTEVASLSDVTTAFTPPAITNLGFMMAGHRTVQLVAKVTETGGQSPVCGFAYWIGAGPTSIVSAGIQADQFELKVGGLTPGSAYAFAAFASNSAGMDWSGVKSFSTHPVPDVFYAATNGSNTAGTNWSSGYTNLQAALDLLEPDDTLYLAGHVFASSPGFEQDTLLTWQNDSQVTVVGGYAAADDVVLPGSRDSAQWPTVLTRGGGYSRILMASGLTNCLLRDVTVRNGFFNSVQAGAGLYVVGCSNLTLESCAIISNIIAATGTSLGAGLYVASGTVTITNSSISSNSLNGIPNAYGYGGGLYINGGTVLIARSLILKNYASGNGYYDGYGGGLFVKAGATAIVRQSVISRNTAAIGHAAILGGGGINNAGRLALENCLIDHNTDSLHLSDGILSSGNLSISNCTIAHNGNTLGTGIRYVSGTIGMTNSIVWGHLDDMTNWPNDKAATPTVSNVFYTCIEDGDNINTQGCFAADPLFADTNYYHLQSRAGYYTGGTFSGGSWSVASAGSPCIDAGDPASGFGLEPAPNGNRVNLGAYGNTEVASKTRGITGTLLLIR
jgi:hypothetical protein